MRKIIIFGATGHVGAYTFEYLNEKLGGDFEFILTGRRKTNFFEKYNVSYVTIDICKKNDFELLPKDDVYCVIHLAGIMPATMKGFDPYKYVDVNITGSLNVFEYSKNVGCKKVIITTTEADLSGYWEPGAVIESDLTPKFDYKVNYSMYISSRLMVLNMLKIYEEKYGVIGYAIRCSTIYCYTESPYMYKNGELIIPGYRQIYQKAICGDDIELWGNPNVKTDIVYVKDFAQLVYKMILSNNNYGGIYNIGTGMPVSLYEQISIAIDVLGEEKKSKIIYRPDMPDGRDFVQSISKAVKELGFQPIYDYRKYLEDYKEEMHLNKFGELFNRHDN